MGLHPFVIGFMTLWMTGALVAFVVSLSAVLRGGATGVTVLIPSGVLVFGYALVTGVFKFESAKARAFLGEALDARLVAT